MIEKYIIGHNKQIEILENDVNTANIPHSYLFAGHRHIGKFPVATRLVQFMYCKNMCGACPNCLQILGHSHPDTIWLKGKVKEKIKIESVRNIIHFMNQTSVSGRKVCLVEDIEHMRREAANALLKIVEEPPSNSHFILTTSNINQVLPTIISRCRVVRFSLVSNDQIISECKKVVAEPKELKAIMPFVNGRPGRLVKLLNDNEAFNRQKEWYKTVQNVVNNFDVTQRFQLAQDIAQDPHDIKRFLTNMVYYLRDELKYSKKKNRVVSLIRTTEKARDLLQKNVNAKLVLEHVMLEIS